MLLQIRKVRLQKGLRQSDVSKMAGVAPGVLSRVECGVLVPWPALRRRLAAVYAVPERELFSDVDDAHEFLRRRAGETP